MSLKPLYVVRMLRKLLYFLLFCQTVSNFAYAQKYYYVSTTEDRAHDITVTKEKAKGKNVLTLEENKLYSKHIFNPSIGTEQWSLRDEKSDHDFVARREGELIRISGTFHGKPVEKEVDIDEDVWFNKLDHGLSAFAISDQQKISFWVLKLLSDMDAMKMIAEKEGVERVDVGGRSYEAVKVKLVLDHFILSKLWSARCWYRLSDGLFLRYEGANGRPGTPVTTIELQKEISSIENSP